MARRTILIFSGAAVLLGVGAAAFQNAKPANKGYSLDSPEGQAIHRSMMIQMQQQSDLKKQQSK